MYIDIVVPYEPSKQLGLAYNRAIDNSSADWLLILDYDVMIIHHRFYDICMSAISKVDSTCGWITCKTNRLGSMTKIHQLCTDAPKDDDLGAHSIYSRRLYASYGDSVVNITAESKQVPLSGFFILTPRKVAESVRFRDGFLGVDNFYCNDLLAQGYTTWMIPGLYCYHRRWREWRGDE